MDALREPMFLLLMAAVALYLVLGEVKDAMALGVAVVFVVSITVFQANRTERVLNTAEPNAS